MSHIANYKSMKRVLLGILIVQILVCSIIIIPHTSEAVAGASGNAIICISIDDGQYRDYKVFEVFSALGLVGTSFVVTDLIDTDGFLTTAELLDMQAGGWEIGSHSKTHAYVNTLTGAPLTAELQGSRDALTAMGINCTSFAYPFGSYTVATQNAAKALYQNIRGTTPETADYRYVTSYTTMFHSRHIPNDYSEFTALIDDAIARGSMLPLHFHSVSTDGHIQDGNYAPFDITIQQVANYLKTKQDAGLLTTMTYAGFKAHAVAGWGIPANSKMWLGDGAVALSANNASLWWPAGVPAANNNVIFNGNHTAPCTWDLAVNLGDFVMMEGYTGTVAPTADFSVRDWLLMGGIYNGGTSKTMTISGDLFNPGPNLQGPLTWNTGCINMTGDGARIWCKQTFYQIIISGNVTMVGPNDPTPRTLLATALVINNGATLTIADGYRFQARMDGSYTNNGGVINGGGLLWFYFSGASKTVDLNNINCDVLISLHNTATAERSLTMASDAVVGGSITIESLHATYRMKMITGGKNLTCDGLYLSTRGTIDLDTARLTLNGDLNTTSGVWDPEYSHVVLAGEGYVDLADHHALYNLSIVSGSEYEILDMPLATSNFIDTSGIFIGAIETTDTWWVGDHNIKGHADEEFTLNVTTRNLDATDYRETIFAWECTGENVTFDLFGLPEIRYQVMSNGTVLDGGNDSTVNVVGSTGEYKIVVNDMSSVISPIFLIIPLVVIFSVIPMVMGFGKRH